MAKFPDLDLEDFFSDFKKNYKKYDNQEVVDILFSFTDFLNFKENMLKFKKGVVNKDAKALSVKTLLSEDKLTYDKLKAFLNEDLKLWRKTLDNKKKIECRMY